jgi:NADH-quinone oxidoreductase subunit C
MSDPVTNPATPEALTGKDALQVHYTGAALQALVDSDAFVTAKWDRSELTVEVTPAAIVAACEAAKADGYNFFEDCTAVDWFPAEPRFQVTYHLLSHSLKKRLRLIARVSGDDAQISSITSVWPAANFYEREVFDLFGVRFNGHPRLTRIMMPDNWNGHPLRKDYPVEGYR